MACATANLLYSCFLDTALYVPLAVCIAGRAGGAPGCQTLPARNQADIPSLANAGLALSKQQHYREAADCYRKALSIEPKLREVQLNLGLAEFKLGARWVAPLFLPEAAAAAGGGMNDGEP